MINILTLLVAILVVAYVVRKRERMRPSDKVRVQAASDFLNEALNNPWTQPGAQSIIDGYKAATTGAITGVTVPRQDKPYVGGPADSIFQGPVSKPLNEYGPYTAEEKAVGKEDNAWAQMTIDDFYTKIEKEPDVKSWGESKLDELLND